METIVEGLWCVSLLKKKCIYLWMVQCIPVLLLSEIILEFEFLRYKNITLTWKRSNFNISEFAICHVVWHGNVSGRTYNRAPLLD